jgi:hypothetical protein
MYQFWVSPGSFGYLSVPGATTSLYLTAGSPNDREKLWMSDRIVGEKNAPVIAIVSPRPSRPAACSWSMPYADAICDGV